MRDFCCDVTANRFIERGAALELDKGKEITPLRDYVDFAVGRAKTFGENATAVGGVGPGKPARARRRHRRRRC